MNEASRCSCLFCGDYIDNHHCGSTMRVWASSDHDLWDSDDDVEDPGHDAEYFDFASEGAALKNSDYDLEDESDSDASFDKLSDIDSNLSGDEVPACGRTISRGMQTNLTSAVSSGVYTPSSQMLMSRVYVGRSSGNMAFPISTIGTLTSSESEFLATPVISRPSTPLEFGYFSPVASPMATPTPSPPPSPPPSPTLFPPHISTLPSPLQPRTHDGTRALESTEPDEFLAQESQFMAASDIFVNVLQILGLGAIILVLAVLRFMMVIVTIDRGGC
ncbi:hypothetical protein CC80DRAFT_500192 [Byssothecium circinans]|uniref:Uncharacterized protein n=1 Tax=Byssothecium circinans TaxID=147558 RepID=A0A6A5U9I8_9PLEO|nr:hypothetical protein CC80DRAFT_500192 [Byssothecium circinans]